MACLPIGLLLTVAAASGAANELPASFHPLEIGQEQELRVHVRYSGAAGVAESFASDSTLPEGLLTMGGRSSGVPWPGTPLKLHRLSKDRFLIADDYQSGDSIFLWDVRSRLLHLLGRGRLDPWSGYVWDHRDGQTTLYDLPPEATQLRKLWSLPLPRTTRMGLARKNGDGLRLMVTQYRDSTPHIHEVVDLLPGQRPNVIPVELGDYGECEGGGFNGDLLPVVRSGSNKKCEDPWSCPSFDVDIGLLDVAKRTVRFLGKGKGGWFAFGEMPRTHVYCDWVNSDATIRPVPRGSFDWFTTYITRDGKRILPY